MLTKIKEEIINHYKCEKSKANALGVTRLIFFKAQEMKFIINPTQLNDLVDELLSEINCVYEKDTDKHMLTAGSLKNLLEKVPENTRVFIDSGESLKTYQGKSHDLVFYEDNTINCIQPFQALISENDGKVAVCITTHY